MTSDKPEALSSHIQTALIYYGITDDEVAENISISVDPKHFLFEPARFCAQIIAEFYRKYKQAPQDDFWEVAQSLIPEGKTRLYQKYFEKVAATQSNKEYILKNLNTFIRYQATSAGIIKGAELVNSGKIDEAEAAVINSFKEGVKRADLGIDYTRDKTHIDIPEIVCPTGIEHLDNEIEGIRRTEIMVWLGGTNVGKSWALIHLGKMALIQGKVVLHYTLGDLSPGWMKARYDMTFTAMATSRRVINEMGVKSLIENKMLVLKKRRFINSLGGRLFIKGSPYGGLTTHMIEADLKMFQLTVGVLPDIILVDYPDLMASVRHYNEKRHEISDIYKGLKDIAEEYVLAVVAVSQTNRAGIDAKMVSWKHFAEDIQKAQHADVIATLCQTAEEKAKHIMRMFLLKNRNAPVGAHFELTYNYGIGQFALDSQNIEEFITNE